MSNKQLNALCEELRAEIIDTVCENGGHLASNLGTVELTLALHYVFDTPKDKLIWDVGHQCYAHKLITGRADKFSSLRKFGGLSGFASPAESEYDTILGGHSSTSLSQALGICRARDIKGEKFKVVAIIGDGALSGGMAFEALNDIGNSKTPLVIVLNDNEMSIEKNVGAVSRHLSKRRLSKSYRVLKRGMYKLLLPIPLIGKPIIRLLEYIKRTVQKVFVSRSIFDCLGIKYAGTFDGNDTAELIKAFKNAAEMDRPVLLHVYTKKGKGYKPSENMPCKYHSVKKDLLCTHTEYSRSFGRKLTELAEKDIRITAVTAAMKDGTGLTEFSERHPSRFFDVGICEQHAVTLCAGMAQQGLKPYFAVYSTFLQRAFDQISNDVCIPALPVTFVIDRSGLVGADGETHHGTLDISFLSAMPNMTIYAPKDKADLGAALEFSTAFNSPLAIRYENEYFGEFENRSALALGKWEVLSPLTEVNIAAYGGRMLRLAESAAEILKKQGIECGIINAAFIKPFDTEMLRSLTGKLMILEECFPSGSLASAAAVYAGINNKGLKIIPFNLPEKYITFGTNQKLYETVGFTAENIAAEILK